MDAYLLANSTNSSIEYAPSHQRSTSGKSFCKPSYQLRMHGPEKGQQQGRDERMQKDYLASAKNTQHM